MAGISGQTPDSAGLPAGKLQSHVSFPNDTGNHAAICRFHKQTGRKSTHHNGNPAVADRPLYPFSVHWAYCKELPILQQIKSIYGILSLKRYLKRAGRITLDNCTIYLPIIPDPVKQELTIYILQAQKEHNFDIFTICNMVLKHRILPDIRWHICPYREDLKTYKDRWKYNYNSFRCIHYIRKQLKRIRKEIQHDQNTDQNHPEQKPETHA